MIRKMTWLTVAIVVAALVFGACEVTVTQIGDAYGIVVDADSGAAIADAKVTLTELGDSSPSETDTTNTNGEYDFSLVPVGVYELTAEKDGMVFTKEIVDVTWGDGEESLPTVAGFTPASVAEVKIIALWDPSFYDVDAYLTIPDGDKVTGVNLVTQSYGVYDYNTTPSNIALGFNPEYSSSTGIAGDIGTSGGDRNAIFYASAASKNLQIVDGNSLVAQMDTNNEGAAGQPMGGPETISLRLGPFVSETHTSLIESGDDNSGLPNGSYTWTGVYEYYLVAWNKGSSSGTEDKTSRLATADNKGAANPRIYVYSTDSAGNTSLIGQYVTPEYTDIKRATYLRINTFRVAGDQYGAEYFQILPDLRIVPDVRSTNYSPVAVEVSNRK